ncbi:hypothetical protein IMCC3135_13550 [Granulosicoccus antarcticus IMCC3135]|uniref:Uncharacterized protein n=1 Tax=Granulosicoccus antarcticus IMCC3135 TaxID=1192854 RepID=A0A2Z2NQM3_9GAMM|nr:hypothetical protein IMCC3135_13550 [Granulosicoccus antarcticus IMCC3135]
MRKPVPPVEVCPQGHCDTDAARCVPDSSNRTCFDRFRMLGGSYQRVLGVHQLCHVVHCLGSARNDVPGMAVFDCSITSNLLMMFCLQFRPFGYRVVQRVLDAALQQPSTYKSGSYQQ